MTSERNLEPWREGDVITAQRLEVMQHLARTAQLESVIGGGARMYQGATGGTAMAFDDPPTARKHVCTVKLDSARTARAWYKAYIWDLPATSPDTTVTPATADLGTQGEEVSVLNLQEAGAASASVTGHDLTHADNVAQLLYWGYFTGESDEAGRRVVRINGAWLGPCVVEES